MHQKHTFIIRILFFLLCTLITTMATINGAVQGVFWDVDGTLVFTGSCCYDATVKTLINNGLPGVTEEEYHACNKYSTPQRFAYHATRDPTDPIGKELGDQFDTLLCETVSSEITPLFEGIQALVQRIANMKGIKLGALSNAGGRYVKAVLKTNHIYEDFDVTLGADEVPTPKPSPNGLLYMCKTLGVNPEKCIYIGDSPSDGKAGKAAGMVSVGVSWGSNSRQKLEPSFDYVTDSVAELDQLIDSLVSTN